MWRYALRRLLLIIPVLLGVAFVVFVILSLAPGDPAVSILGDKASEEDLAAMREKLGLNKPIPVRFLNYVANALRGDWEPRTRTSCRSCVKC